MEECLVKKKVRDLYSPKNAFGNEILISEIKILENIEKEKEARKHCKICNGSGIITEKCLECDGTGQIEIECNHQKND